MNKIVSIILGSLMAFTGVFTLFGIGANDLKASAEESTVTVGPGIYQFDKDYTGEYFKSYFKDSLFLPIKKTSSSPITLIDASTDRGYSYIESYTGALRYFWWQSSGSYSSNCMLNYSAGSYSHVMVVENTTRDVKTFVYLRDTVQMPLEFYSYIIQTTSEVTNVMKDISGNDVLLALDVDEASGLVSIPDAFFGGVPSSYYYEWYAGDEFLDETTVNLHSYVNGISCYLIDRLTGVCYKFEVVGGQLATPVIQASELPNTLFWNEVRGAERYEVTDLTNQKNITVTEDNFIKLSSEYDDCYISVRAISSDEVYEPSNWATPFLFSYVNSSDMPTVQLDTPVISTSSNLLVWSVVNGADYYLIYRDGILVGSTTQNVFSASVSGSYSVVAKAYNPVFLDSDSSESVDFDSSVLSLLSPRLRLENDVLIWEQVLDATSYLVYRNGDLLAETTYLQFEITLEGSYTVAAKNESYTSYMSNVVAVLQLKDEALKKEWYNRGYQNGYNAGIEQGFKDGQSTDTVILSFFQGVIDTPIKALQGLLNFKILGFDLYGFFQGLVTLAVVVAVVKIVFFFL